MEIEERAKEYVNASLYDNSVTRKQYSYRAYIKGATEQMQRAKRAFCKIHCDAPCGGEKLRDTCTSLGTCNDYDNFVKAMEE